MDKIIRINYGQDLFQQKEVIKMYGISHSKICELEKRGLKRYQQDSRSVLYSLKEVEEALKKASIV